jgi:signal transduction histidine kinase
MRSSIRNQILVPLIAVQVATVATIALLEARLASGRVEEQVAGRLEGVVETLGRSNFPLTSGVLEKMRGLSGAHFVACGEGGQVLESTLTGLSELPPSLRALPTRTRLDPPGTSPKVDLGGEGYFAASVRSAGGPTLLVLYPEAVWRRARWEASWPPLAVGVLSLAPMALVTGLLAHRLGVRLRSVRGRVAAIASGDFQELDDQGRSGGDEVDDLIRSVNRMAAQLREMGETIRRTERAGVLAQLAAGLAHQLRNAATGARMAIQLHARRCPGPESDGSLDVALRQLTLCEGQIKALLSTGHGSSNSPGSLDASGLIEEVAALVEPACKHVGVELTRGAGSPTFVHADPDRLRAALLNLALNAIEATGTGGNVCLSAGSEGGFVRFDVVDDGPGPTPELASTMFEPFVTGKLEGVGLGLALARRVAADHGGRLSWMRVDDRTRFRLEIPRAVEQEPE